MQSVVHARCCSRSGTYRNAQNSQDHSKRRCVLLLPVPRPSGTARHRCVKVQSFDVDVGETPGVDSLLDRDRKGVRDVSAEELDKAFQDVKEEPTSAEPRKASNSNASTSTSAKPQAKGNETPQGVRTAKEAILTGIATLRAGNPQAAVELFQKALELPGNGAMRFAGTVREYRCPSEGEENAALYNMACAYASMGSRESAFTCLDAAMENGFDDFAALRSDPDLDPLRGPEMDKLVGKYDGVLQKVFGKKKKPRSGTEPIFLGF